MRTRNVIDTTLLRVTVACFEVLIDRLNMPNWGDRYKMAAAIQA